MGVKIKLNLALQQLASNRDKVEVYGSTVKQCLDDLIRRFPGAKEWIFDKDGSLVPLVLVNGKVLPPEELNRPVTEKDELWLVSVLTGG